MKSQKLILTLLIENEETLSKLYKIYSQKFDEYQLFWERLSEDEIEHANAIRALEKIADEITEKRFDKDTILEFSAYINIKLNDAKKENQSIEKAIKTAVEIENEIIERQFFEPFDGDSAYLKKAIRYLKETVETHKKAVERALNKLK